MNFSGIKQILYVLALLLCGCCVAQARLYGLERMERFDRLPELLQGTQVRQVSSHDRSGGNDDGFNGTYSYLYVDENGEYVLFDELGAGCLYRFWVTYRDADDPDYKNYRLRFYFDNEAVPRIDKSMLDFFDDEGTPFEFPLVGYFDRSSNGCYCYLPFPYRDRLKITLSGRPLFYNITYHRFDSAAGVVSWSGSEDTSIVKDLWNSVGADPKPADQNLQVSGSVSLPPGSTGTLFQTQGGGVVQSIRIDPSPADTNILSDVWLLMNWDGGDPEVCAPIGDFFGSGRYEIEVASLPIGMKDSGDWYCYFPMPYWLSADVKIENRGTHAVTSFPFEIQYATNVMEQTSNGYFHAAFKETAFANDGQDVMLLDERGRGHIVGLSLFMHGTGTGGYRHTGYLEGDERIFIDGSSWPCVHGTGTEDYFNAGWYFNRGTFNRPCHGCPWEDHMNIDRPNYTQAYRFHLSDVIPFNQSVRFGIEHGPQNDEPGIYSSVTYYYKTAELPQNLIPVLGLHADDSWSEALYHYSNAAPVSVVQHEAVYAGGFDSSSVADTGYDHASEPVCFELPLTRNNGVLLRRRTLQSVGGQAVAVRVDGQEAGVWYDRDETAVPFGRWNDSDFMIPASFTTNKAAVQIELSALSGTNGWNHFRMDGFCVSPAGHGVDADQDQLADAWELLHAGSLTNLTAGQDCDGDGLADEDEYAAGTDPADPASVPLISYDPTVDSITLETELGRFYTVMVTTNLADGTWLPVRPRFTGTGSRVALPITHNAPAAGYRFVVEKP